jgi:methyltransferase (TIGR00027 family)
VVIVGAGYDSRAWRLARPGVRFLEVDHPATQADKQRRAPRGGPIYVAADLEDDDLRETLRGSGLVNTETTMYVVEGLMMYLREDRVRMLLKALSQLGGPLTTLVTNFGIGLADEARGIRGQIRRALIALRGEPFRFRLAPHEAAAFLEQTGWTISASMAGPEVAQRFLHGSELPPANLHRDILFVLATPSSACSAPELCPTAQHTR